MGIILSLLLVSQFAHAEKKKRLKIKVCTVTPEGTPWEQIAKEVFKHIRKDSEGQIKLKVYWAGPRAKSLSASKKSWPIKCKCMPAQAAA